ncbi:MAG: DNA polymerase beta superfamily protein [Cellulosilyticaceae bacterium]
MEIGQVIQRPEYAFLKANEHLGDNIVFLALGGSYAYGTNVATSDIDIRGCTLPRKQELIGLSNFEQFEDRKTDTTIYSFNKLIQLMCNCNPNTIEMLGCKEAHYALVSPIGSELLANKKMFLSQRAKQSFEGYATAQLRRLQNAVARDALSQSDKEIHIMNAIKSAIGSFNERYSYLEREQIEVYIDKSQKADRDTEVYLNMALRGYPLRDSKGMLSEMSEIVRLYDKLNHRNNKKDALHLNKHAMHLIRLYLMAIDIFEKEEIITYREKEIPLLMSIREGKFMHEDGTYDTSFFDMVGDFDKRLDYATKHTSLPEYPDMKQVEAFVIAVHEKVVKGEHA